MPAMSDPHDDDFSIEDVLDQKQAYSDTVTVSMNPETAHRLADLRMTLDRAKRMAEMRSSDLEAMAAEAEAQRNLDEAVAEAKSSGQARTFRFMALGRQEFEDLRDLYPATKEQRNEYRKLALSQGVPPAKVGTLGYDPDKFPPALIAASCVSPTMDDDQAKRLWDSPKFSQSELQALFYTAMSVNSVDTTVDLGEG